tara:strand:- start:42173 stop:43030 length:858 start_codon:yes stop_codon:yes gene_type:complete
VKILVTGGAGFIGSCLIERLVKSPENEVVSLDNYFTGKETNHIAGAKYIKGETSSIFDLVDFSPDIIYHFGEYSRVSTSFDDISRVWDYNVAGTYAVLEFCKQNSSKLIYSASSTKFGDGGDNRHASPYAFYKSVNSDLINNYGSWFGLEYAICYFYNVYGAGQISEGKYATVIGIFEEKYSNSKPLTVTSPGTQKRDFTHISDIIDGLSLLMSPDVSGDGFCFGTGKDYTILDVVELFESDYVFIPARPGERIQTSIDLSKSRSIGWSPKVCLKEYIEDIKHEK